MYGINRKFKQVAICCIVWKFKSKSQNITNRHWSLFAVLIQWTKDHFMLKLTQDDKNSS